MTGFAEISQNEMMAVDGGVLTDEQITAIMVACGFGVTMYATVALALAGLHVAGPGGAVIGGLVGFFGGYACSQIIGQALIA